MKAFALLFLPVLALANEPKYDVPQNADKSFVHCETKAQVKEATENGWSDWTSVEETEDSELSFWMGDYTDFYSLEKTTDGNKVVYKKTTELEPKRKHLKEIETWVKDGSEWKMTSYTSTWTFTHQANNPIIRVVEERSDTSATFVWDTKLSFQGDPANGSYLSIYEKTLLNPSAMNTEQKKFSAYSSTCVHVNN